MEFLMVLLIALTVIGLIQLSLIKRKVQTFDIETLSLRNRLENLKREIEALVRLARGERGPARSEPTPAPIPKPGPPPIPPPVPSRPQPVQPAMTTEPVISGPAGKEKELSPLAVSVRDILRRFISCH